ncbi:MAG: serine kinase [Thermoplasmata archaeon]|nr:MAG: serine kinase [Desulfobacteraceae bacterium 4484_190.3]RLB14926.1 MAG: serine kinase [Deltaproteobacteria bacterium]RLF55085.1 MAG: serine kinase [Thermoplasmata archaeon]HDZ23746.1 serine kinase [Desulfobacteraceae bacterium]
MKLADIVHELSLDLLTGESGLDREVSGGYCGDLLSDVMANAEKGSVWITIQRHQNIIAVALLKELAAIIFANGYHPDPETLEKAKEEGIPLLVSSLAAYELAGNLYKAGIE